MLEVRVSYRGVGGMAARSPGRPARVPRAGAQAVQSAGRGTKNEPDPPGEVGSPARKRAPRTPAVSDLVVDAVKRDLAVVAKADAALGKSGLALLALALAREVDSPFNSATSKSMCAGQLRDTLDRLVELMPPAVEKDDLDDLSRRRAARLAGGAGASGRSRT